MSIYDVVLLWRLFIYLLSLWWFDLFVEWEVCLMRLWCNHLSFEYSLGMLDVCTVTTNPKNKLP